jgi:hypothetical protein
MYKTICLVCKKEFTIPFSDFRYKDIKYNRGKPHVCDKCCFTIRDDANKVKDINQDTNHIDKILRERSF